MRAEALGDVGTLAARLDNRTGAALTATPVPAALELKLERVADVPIYSTDALVRRAPSLQATADAKPPMVGVPSALWRQLGLQAGDRVRVSQGVASATLPAREDATLAANTVRIATGHPSTVMLGAMFGAIDVERLGT